MILRLANDLATSFVCTYVLLLCVCTLLNQRLYVIELANRQLETFFFFSYDDAMQFGRVEGDNLKAVECYMSETGTSEEAARDHIKYLMRETMEGHE